MKTLTLLFVLFATFQFSQAAVHTVNNNNPSPGQFTTLQAAINAATAGDTIYIHGSPNPYQLSELVKQLTFIGTGFNPQNANNTRSILNQFSIGGISAVAGLAASGSRFEGLTIMQNMIVHFNSQITGLVFKRCALHRVISIASSNWIFEECVFGPVISDGVAGNVSFSNNPSNTTFQNCLFVYTTAATGFSGASLHTLFLNNTFIRAGADANALNTSTTNLWSQAIIEGNIFFNTNPNINCNNCTFTRNISFSPQGITLNDLNNVSGSSLNQITNPLFVAIPINNLTNAPNWNIVQTAG